MGSARRARTRREHFVARPQRCAELPNHRVTSFAALAALVVVTLLARRAVASGVAPAASAAPSCRTIGADPARVFWVTAPRS
jgi:hypothetical protein